MELHRLRYFVAVARERSFTRAASKLRVAQPALSTQLRALERELGVVLIERSNRTGALTEAGERLLLRAERILAEVHDASEEMAARVGRGGGVVRIGCALQTLMESSLPALFARFQARYPDVRVTLDEVHTEQVLQRVGRAELDLGIVHLGRRGSDRPIGSRGAGADVALLQLRREPLVLIVGPNHHLAGRTSVAFRRLRAEPFVLFHPGSTVRALVEAAARQSGFEPRVAFASANVGTVRALVSAGLGIAVVPESACAQSTVPLCRVPLTAPRLERIVALARNKARYQSPAVEAMRALIAEALRRPR